MSDTCRLQIITLTFKANKNNPIAGAGSRRESNQLVTLDNAKLKASCPTASTR